MESNYIKIIAQGPTTAGAKVMLGDSEIDGVTRIEIHPMEVGGLIEATITVSVGELDVSGVKLA
jgi:hypothetical protein